MAGNYHFSINNLSCRRGGRVVFSNLSFDVGAGEALAIAGPNGSGKTTLLRLLAGLLPSEEALIFSNGTPLPTEAHFIGTKAGAKTHLSVKENLQFWRTVLGGSGDVARVLQIFDLAALQDMPTGFLSSGQRQRLALSRLFVAARPLWLLDEPLSALDEENQERLSAAIERHLHSGGMAVIAAHGETKLPHTKTLQLGALA